MDFGHRAYPTEDPLAACLRVTSAGHAGTRGDDTCFGMSRRNEEVVAMTRQARHALPGFVPSAVPARKTGGTVRSGKTGGAAELAGTVGLVAYLAVLVAVASGVYIAWRLGSHGGGGGGAVAGSALLVAAVVRLVLPGRLAGLLASRCRLTDVLTLTVFGTCLLAVGLVLPR